MQNLTQLKQRHALLGTKLAKAKAAHDAALAVRQKFLVSSDDIDDEKIAASHQHRVESTASTLAGLTLAHDAVGLSVGETERQIAQDGAEAARKVAADKLAADTKAAEIMIAPWLKQTRDLADHFTNLMPEIFEVGAFARYVADVAIQVEHAAPSVLAELACAVRGLGDGTVPVPARPDVGIAVDAEGGPAEEIVPKPANYPRQRVVHSAHNTFDPLPRGPAYTVSVRKASHD